MWQSVGGDACVTSWHRVVSSPMTRCQDFAQHLARVLGLPLTVEPSLREVGFGAWEGLSRKAVRTERQEEYLAFLADPVGARPPGSECLEAFVQRVRDGLARLEQDHPGEHVLVVTHAGVIRAAVCIALDIPLHAMYRIKVPYAGLTRLTRDERGLMLDHVNRLHSTPPTP